MVGQFVVRRIGMVIVHDQVLLIASLVEVIIAIVPDVVHLAIDVGELQVQVDFRFAA